MCILQSQKVIPMKTTGFVLAILAVALAVLIPCVTAADGVCPDYCANGMTYFRGTYNSRTLACDYASRMTCDYGCDARGTICAAAPVTTVTTVTPSCPDYCSNGITYSRGTYNSRTGSCDYSYRTTCDNGCDLRGTGCAAATVTTTTAVARGCPDYCSGGIHYLTGVWNSITQQCNYMTRNCVHGCDSSQTTCARNPAGCPEYCRDASHYFNGTWNDWTQQCEYAYREQCLSSCDSGGIGCTQTASTQTRSETGRYITCSGDCSCISRQGAVDRWGNNVRMCSGSPCGKMDDGTYLYCIQPTGQTTAQQTSAATERYINCPADCSCISRQGAVDRWQGSVRMCSNSPCGRTSDGTYLYCIQPTDQKTAGIRQRYSGPSETVIAVNPAFEGEQLMFVVSRERQAMLLGFIPMRMTVNTRLNATDLAVVREERPWWGFLVAGEAAPAPAPATPTPTPPPVSGAGACANQSWNEKCYDSAYDLDGDCHMTKDAAASVCGNKIKNGAGEAAYQDWVATYPWDCNDSDPSVWACGPSPAATNCTDSDGKNIFVNGLTKGLDFAGTKIITTSDYCTNSDGGAQVPSGKWVAEEQCGLNGHVEGHYYKCPDCYGCSAGKCVLQTAVGCELSCANQSWNAKCYDSAYDLDRDCNMTKDAALSVCGNKIKNDYGQGEYEIWVASYPWDCNDNDPLQCGFSPVCTGVLCPVKCEGTTLLSDGKCSELTGECIYKTMTLDSPVCKV